MTGPRLGALVALAVLLGGCGSPTSPLLLRGDPRGYLLSLEQLPSPDFTVYSGAAATDAGWLDTGSAATLTRDGFQAAATVEYLRQGELVDLATSNGPITLTSAVARFASPGGAAAAVGSLASALNARAGAVPLSTGPLGDGGHAVSNSATLDSVAVVRITVVWRVANLVNSLAADGRSGGLDLDQLLPVARAQTAAEQASTGASG